ncbi:MAG TPA: hypothetical protein PLT07_05340 [Trueperaceae bacterium]|nr:hypothetical protein [Trueperaceae bacterium]
MADARKRHVVRSRALRKLDELFQAPGICCAIHYSCESFYDNPEGSSRRITSIAIKNLGSGITDSFSIHKAAETKGVAPKDIEADYDSLEKLMLDDFYAYLKAAPNFNWLHWNMRDSNYGFPAIAHRYKVLGGAPESTQPSHLFDLAALLQDIYGPNYIGHPRLAQLAKHNDMTMLGFLTGEEEAQAFVDKQYVLLHQSTLRKVGIIANLAERQWQGTLRTKAKRIEMYGSRFRAHADSITNSPWFKVSGFVTIILGLWQGIHWVVSILSN